MKNWPKDDVEISNYSEIHEPLRKAFLQAISIKKGPKYIKWDGVDKIPCTEHILPSPPNRFDQEYIKARRDQGEDVLDILIHLAFNIGIEQGVRMEKRNSKHYQCTINILKDVIKQRQS